MEKSQSHFAKRALKEPVCIHTEKTTGLFVVGASVQFTVEDARAIMKMTEDHWPSEENSPLIKQEDAFTIHKDEYDALCRCSDLLGTIAKSILIATEPSTPIEDLLQKFKPEVKEDPTIDSLIAEKA